MINKAEYGEDNKIEIDIKLIIEQTLEAGRSKTYEI
jgi:hypothetical protein